MLFNELPIAFPWYEKLEQQNRYRENVEPVCDYKLVNPRDALLPFQFVKDSAGLMPNLWEVFEVNTQAKAADISASVPFLRVRLVEGREYFTYDGRALTTGSGGNMNLAPGWYYSRLSWPDGVLRFSEMFYVPEVGFNIADDDDIPFIKLEWYNDNDLRPIMYNDKQSSGKPYFRNVAYLDTFITASEPEIVEDGTRDGNDELIPTFQKAVITYRMTAPVPDFLKKSLVLLPMHDHVLLTTKNGVRTGEIQKSNVNSALEASGALSIVDVLFSETILLKKGCGENMSTDCAGSAPGLNPITQAGSNYTLSGTAPAGSIVRFYRMNTPTDTPVLAVGIDYTNTQFAAGITIDVAAFYGSNYVVAWAGKFGCDFGFSNVVQKP